LRAVTVREPAWHQRLYKDAASDSAPYASTRSARQRKTFLPSDFGQTFAAPMIKLRSRPSEICSPPVWLPLLLRQRAMSASAVKASPMAEMSRAGRVKL
jgi:hypothetical protein